jgi:hypothetical protein
MCIDPGNHEAYLLPRRRREVIKPFRTLSSLAAQCRSGNFTVYVYRHDSTRISTDCSLGGCPSKTKDFTVDMANELGRDSSWFGSG